jgi:hypothetical protein
MAGQQELANQADIISAAVQDNGEAHLSSRRQRYLSDAADTVTCTTSSQSALLPAVHGYGLSGRFIPDLAAH